MRRADQFCTHRTPRGVLRLRDVRGVVHWVIRGGCQRRDRVGTRRGGHGARRVRPRGQDGRREGFQRHRSGSHAREPNRPGSRDIRARVGDVRRERGRRLAHAADALAADAAAAAVATAGVAADGTGAAAGTAVAADRSERDGSPAFTRRVWTNSKTKTVRNGAFTQRWSSRAAAGGRVGRRDGWRTAVPRGCQLRGGRGRPRDHPGHSRDARRRHHRRRGNRAADRGGQGQDGFGARGDDRVADEVLHRHVERVGPRGERQARGARAEGGGGAAAGGGVSRFLRFHRLRRRFFLRAVRLPDRVRLALPAD